MLWSRPGYFSKSQFSDAEKALLIGHKRQMNKPSEYIKTLSYWWSITGLDYYKGYRKAVAAVKEKDILSFVKKYFVGKKPLETYLLNEEDGKIANLKENVGPLLKKFNLKREGGK